MRVSLILLLAAFGLCVAPEAIAGTPKIPEGKAALSTQGTYADKAVTVEKLNGKKVSMRAAELFLAPGAHQIELAFMWDLRPQEDKWVLYKTTRLTVTLNAEAGHTYMPNGNISATGVSGRFDDLGLNYNRDCLPRRRYTMSGKLKPECPDY